MMNLVSVMNIAIIAAGMGIGMATMTMTTIDRRQLKR